MAFHVGCPLTCRKICTCTLGAAARLRKFGGREAFVQNVQALQKLLAKSPLMITTGEDTVEVLVPRLSKEAKKRRKKPAAASLEPEAEAVETPEIEAEGNELERLEDGGFEEGIGVDETGSIRPEPEVTGTPTSVEPVETVPEETTLVAPQETSSVPSDEVPCRLCSQNEKIGTEKCERMMSCGGCERKFHRNCLKSWASHRDLFNWASWRCLHCRTCEDCKVTGDANRLLFCKRCDEAHHANCKQSGAKAPLKGPFLCPKHSQCHSCGTRIPGSGASSRWFHAYLFCDACGRLFLKNKYCPICLKVYRESEPTPMVCCDKCEHWVHCVCEKISDEKYEEFQKNPNLRFTCAACRGDCFQCKSVDDAIAELWRRKDEADRDQIARLRATAGLPSEEQMAKLYPSDDESREQPVKEASKKEGRLVIKIRKSAAEPKPASAKEQKTPKRGGKSKQALNSDGDRSQDVEEDHKKLKRKRPVEDHTEKDVPAKVLRVKGPGEATPGKITLRVPAKVHEEKETTSEGTHTTGTKDEEDEQSEEHVLSHAETKGRRAPSSKHRDAEASAPRTTSKINEEPTDSSRKRGRSSMEEPQTELKPVRLKIRRQAGVEGAEVAKGQRSKRKRPAAPAEDEAEADTDEDDHSSILQRFGTDAVSKRVEVRQPDQTWLKGTVTAVDQRRGQFTIGYDNGTKKAQKYGKVKIRLLGNR